ncbi:MAG: hypothetical protein A3C49_02825 [Candidatus Doudnabacteria bacterium RIFCSPHIGHO2_02_FULL_42_25]|uniref:Peptidyl-prolyl cis-trans isomerase n=1 Tax=Candidatus Doudnabacteria bacterium RIFCSPHIGHO2_01_FULL_41_86 TaxID=1817821 RepID=A0A1F5N9Y0_9BACT|nr:MAG: hypothetical protein A2717_02420 [Candidatus Doudnabacteria bacterium RIFCSPHIGHO2_01_FULL_41_86]OGE75616.1 MAG: hypothetical protein A3K07_02180 [Candidatus Doudnabacteria bacterium RIFCSPHIGHO2_01_43_10]OGE85411.1 MAG: hypothetical protein A3E28_01990 [Candidatus Doudnabacteria bacterium RIFCSPHIGHO2_12_FULL_42_22]OGE86949.1 MAG: hypothetical protein A3C49_02825 [Candidatus Doudnabacteria bacterium RIFCSPHIGHO2_02_FULL_42_25]OGE92548.1 MAG: hypothetical protein A2895_02980 [Candidatus
MISNGMNKYLAAVVIIILGAGAFFYFTSNKTEAPTNENNQSMNQNTEEQPKVEEKVKPVATIETSLGAFEVTLENEAAPKTVANFVKLSKDGFYNGLTFHRIVKQTGFHLIQGGDPKGDGTGGPGYTIPAEIGLKHTKGAIATARLADAVNPNKESSGSQFYIVEEDIPFLDGNYTVFGYVTKGMDIVEKIGAVETGAMDVPVTKVTINKITIKE